MNVVKLAVGPDSSDTTQSNVLSVKVIQLPCLSCYDMLGRLFTEYNFIVLSLEMSIYLFISTTFSSVHDVLILPHRELLENSLRSWRNFHSRQNFLLTSESFKTKNVLTFLSKCHSIPDIPLDLERWKMISSLVFFLLSRVSSLFLVAISFLHSLFR